MHAQQLFTDYRKRQGLTQQQAADLAMISRRQVQKIERGDSVGARSRLALAEALGIPANERLDGTGCAELDSFSQSIETSDALLDPSSQSDEAVQSVYDCPDFGHKISEAEVEFSIRRMRRSWLRHLELSVNVTSDYDKMLFAADQRLNENVEAYVERYMGLWRRMPDVIQISRVNGRKTGISVVLPVSTEAYRDLRSGQKSFMDIGAADLQRNSGYLVIDSLVEFADAPQRKWYDITSSLRDAIFWQLTHLAGYPLPENLRILSFGASSSNARRLQAAGFVGLNQLLKDHGYPLYELARDNSDLEEVYTRCESDMHFANLLGRLLAESASMNFGIRVKRAAFINTMKLFQGVDRFRQKRDAG